MGAGALLCSLLINTSEEQLGYSKPLILLHDAVPVNVTRAVGIKGSVPSLAPDQPTLLQGPRSVLILTSVIWRLLDHCVLNLQIAV